jgi:tRNA(fMet)-specific endonuclease VapC
MSVQYLLDTDTCVAWLRGDPLARQRIGQAPPGTLGIALMSLAELRYGAAVSKQAAANHKTIDSFLTRLSIVGMDPAVAGIFGDVKADLRARGLLLEDADLLIAATALTYQLTLVTNNTQHFSRIPGLRLENWLLP